jgi:hypothetical protein
MERKHIFRWGALGVIGMKIQVFLISLNYDISECVLYHAFDTFSRP